MKNFKRICLIIVLLFSLFLLPSCTLGNDVESDPSTFDEFADSIFDLLLNGDELSSNILFEKPEEFGLQRYEPSLPTPSTGSLLGTIVINAKFSPLYTYDFAKLNEDQQITYLILDNLVNKVNETSGFGYLDPK